VETFARVGVGWFATCIVGGIAVVAGGVLAPPDYALVRVVLIVFGVAAIGIGVSGIVAELVILSRRRRSTPSIPAARPSSPPTAASSEARRWLIRRGEFLADALAETLALRQLWLLPFRRYSFEVAMVRNWDAEVDRAASHFGWTLGRSRLAKVVLTDATWRRALRGYVLERVSELMTTTNGSTVQERVPDVTLAPSVPGQLDVTAKQIRGLEREARDRARSLLAADAEVQLVTLHVLPSPAVARFVAWSEKAWRHTYVMVGNTLPFHGELMRGSPITSYGKPYFGKPMHDVGKDAAVVMKLIQAVWQRIRPYPGLVTLESLVTPDFAADGQVRLGKWMVCRRLEGERERECYAFTDDGELRSWND
jgi:hypothetical protein